jgi:molybdate transport system substrate-binding protein
MKRREEEEKMRRVRLSAPRIAMLLALGLGLALWVPLAARAADLHVLGPTSLQEALEEANATYSALTGTRILVSYDASGTQAKQIEAGTRADLFIAGGLEWVDYLEARKLIKPDTRANLVRNRLALIAPKSDRTSLEILPGFPLKDLLGDGKLSIADPEISTAGVYARTALQRLGAWPSVEKQLLLAPNLRSTLVNVSQGKAPFGITFETEVQADPGVRLVAIFPSGSYSPIVYPMAVLASSTNIEAAHYATWLRSYEAMPSFAKRGFTLIGAVAGH